MESRFESVEGFCTKSKLDLFFYHRVGRSFFRRLRAQHPRLKKKRPNKVSVSRGLNCTRKMAVSYLDELAEELIEAGIATNMKKIKNGKWEGDIDVSR